MSIQNISFLTMKKLTLFLFLLLLVFSIIAAIYSIIVAIYCTNTLSVIYNVVAAVFFTVMVYNSKQIINYIWNDVSICEVIGILSISIFLYMCIEPYLLIFNTCN